MFFWVYLMCSNNCDKPSKPTGDSFAELEAYISGMNMALENEKK